MKRKNTPRKTNSVRSFERLENRDLMAGDVTVSVVSGDLLVNGDSAANMLQMTEVSGNRWKITGLAGTTINGKSKFTTDAVSNDVQINLGGGDDNILIKKGTVAHILNVFGEDGNNFTALEKVDVDYGLGVYGNDGNDVVVADKVNVQAINGIYYSVFDLGNGNNTVIANKLGAWDFRVYTGSGMDNVSITNSTLQSASTLTLNTGDGKDSVAVLKVKTNTLNVDVGNGTMDSVSSQKSTADTANFAVTNGNMGIISGVKNLFQSLSVDGNFTIRSGDFQHII